MRKLLILTCCVGLASLVSAAKHDDQDGNQGKKKGGAGNGQQQVAASQTVPQTGKKFKATGTGVQNFQQPGTVGNLNQGGNKFHKWQGQGNLSSNANNTSFNKTKNVTINKNLTVNKNFNFQKKHFNLQTNNKQFVVNKYKTVNFNGNYKIAGANKWKGAKYSVFVNYHPLWHDQWWWTSHHNHIVFIYGGWYYWDRNYWYPAWGYAPDSVYVYDGPVYASSPSEDPGQVIANVQSALQQQGYYQGDIDGILGPETRAALAEYQTAQGIEPTGAVDEPTLETLGMA
jgi:putative peptidoglycan binding protein